MLSLSRGKNIAQFTDGKMKGKFIKLFGSDDFSKDTLPDISIPRKEYSELIDKQFYKETPIPINKRTLFKMLLNEEKKNDDTVSDEMKEYVNDGVKYVENKLKTEILFEDKTTKLFPLPQKFSERIYVPAPSGSGKSTFIGMYLDELKKAFPNKKRKLFVFSRVEKDPPLDKHKPIRIPLEEAFFDKNPLAIKDFENSIIIFDDIDTILNKKVVKYVRNFRDDILETGRHYNISILSTSHLIANFLATRTLINEANSIVLFPRGSSFAAVANFLERYLGFTRNQIRMVENLPTRWIWFWKEYPKYAIHEKGAFIY
jgi:hypothetical protein